MSEQDPAVLEPSPTNPPEGSPDPAATLEPAPLTGQEQPGGGPAPAEGGEGGAQKTEPPAWAAIPEASGVLEHESIAPLVEERVNTAREAAKKEGHSEAHRRLQPLMDRQQDTLRGIDERLTRFSTDWNRLTRAKDADGNPAIDPARLQDLLDDNRESLAALGGLHRNEGVWSGAAGLVKELANAMSSDAFSSDFRPRLERMQRGDTDSGIFTDMVEAIAGSAKKPLQDELKEAKAQITRLESEAREAKRNGQPAPANPPGGAATSPTDRAAADAVLRSGKTTPEEKKAAFQRKHGLDIASIGR